MRSTEIEHSERLEHAERKLKITFYKFLGRYPELASKFNIISSCDSVPMAQLYHTSPQVMK